MSSASTDKDLKSPYPLNFRKPFDEATSDCTIVVNDKKFHVHKTVILNSSLVFETMMRTQMTEGITYDIKVDDCSEEVMVLLINVLYGQEIDQMKLRRFHEELMMLAHKYQITPVVDLCGKSIAKFLDERNVYEKIRQAELFECGSLLNAALLYIVRECQPDRSKIETLSQSACHSLVLAYVTHLDRCAEAIYEMREVLQCKGCKTCEDCLENRKSLKEIIQIINED